MSQWPCAKQKILQMLRMLQIVSQISLPLIFNIYLLSPLNLFTPDESFIKIE